MGFVNPLHCTVSEFKCCILSPDLSLDGFYSLRIACCWHFSIECKITALETQQLNSLWSSQFKFIGEHKQLNTPSQKTRGLPQRASQTFKCRSQVKTDGKLFTEVKSSQTELKLNSDSRLCCDAVLRSGGVQRHYSCCCSFIFKTTNTISSGESLFIFLACYILCSWEFIVFLHKCSIICNWGITSHKTFTHIPKKTGANTGNATFLSAF